MRLFFAIIFAAGTAIPAYANSCKAALMIGTQELVPFFGFGFDPCADALKRCNVARVNQYAHLQGAYCDVVDEDTVTGPSRPQSKNVRCTSIGQAYRTCHVPNLQQGTVTLTLNHGGYPCTRNVSWGTSGSFIWVRNGCDATFRVNFH